MKLLLTSVLVATALRGSAPQSSTELGPDTLYIFLGSETPAGERLARRSVKYALTRKGSIELRPVLLIEDWKALSRLTKESPLVRILKELERLGQGKLGLPMYDEEGLLLVRRWRITRIPAIALVSHGRVHIAFGSRATPEELETCR